MKLSNGIVAGVEATWPWMIMNSLWRAAMFEMKLEWWEDNHRKVQGKKFPGKVQRWVWGKFQEDKEKGPREKTAGFGLRYKQEITALLLGHSKKLILILGKIEG